MSNQLDEINARIARINLKKKRIAALSGLDEDTVGRTLNKKTVPLKSTLDRIVEAVDLAENELREALGVKPAGTVQPSEAAE